ncbi:chromosome transmission fidelity factor [Dorcoceras hygrometricum]|uniref:Chromosome transmission fidelity factor n=1 Tax=Dorcoceras hygrometricum TaxID=472368 RepID=A0A2Z7AB56_9LAMI|nr:chromosome transmission fidelity factor [Dorcoceras hygrometricum]
MKIFYYIKRKWTDAPYYHLGTRGPSTAPQARPTVSRSVNRPKTCSKTGLRPRPLYLFESSSRGQCPDVRKSLLRIRLSLHIKKKHSLSTSARRSRASRRGGVGSSAEIIWLHQLVSSVGNVEERQDANKEDQSSGYWRN